MLLLHNIGRLINALSIDVALGAWACSRLFYFGTNHIPNTYVDIALILTVWLIYTADHLYDAKRKVTHELSFRHNFHKTYFRQLLFTLILITVALASVVIFLLPQKTILFGFLLSILVGIHFLINHLLKAKVAIGKEARIAIIYSFGTVIPILSMTNGYSWQQLFIILHIGLLAFENLLVFSLAERSTDLLDDLPSINKKWSPEKLAGAIKIVLTMHLGLVIASYFYIHNTLLTFLIIGMYVVMLSVFLTFEKHLKMDRYRILADGLFLLPLIAIFLQ